MKSEIIEKLNARISKKLADISRRKPSGLVYHSQGVVWIKIYENGNKYPIETRRMDTPEKVLGWIHHLAKKGNVTTEHIRAFIETAKDIGVKIDFHC